MMTATCPSCGEEAQAGRFCSACGAELAQAPDCASCGAELPPKARYCNQCGTRADVDATVTRQRLARGAEVTGVSGVRSRTEITSWVVAGLAVGILLTVLILPRLQQAETEISAAPAAGPIGDPSSVDISSMTPRERATRLFNRVMQSVSTGDSAQARAFLPMALAAYGQIPELELDDRYHYAVLHLVDQDPEAARAQADTILLAEPNHLFGHFTAAQAAQAMGDTTASQRHYRRFLDSYDSEVGRDLVEYRDHAEVLPVNREEALRRLGSP